MKITRVFENNFSRSSLSSQDYDSSRLLEHVDELIRNNPGVMDPGNNDFNGEVLSYAVYRELLKLNKPIEFILVISTMINHAMAFISNADLNQDKLMDLKRDIVRNAVCLLQRDKREKIAALLNSGTLNDLSEKLLWFYDNQMFCGDQPKAFYAIEMISILNFYHHFLHGNYFQVSYATIRPSQDEMALLEAGYSRYCSK